jgi:hypothetical protein
MLFQRPEMPRSCGASSEQNSSESRSETSQTSKIRAPLKKLETLDSECRFKEHITHNLSRTRIAPRSGVSGTS